MTKVRRSRYTPPAHLHHPDDLHVTGRLPIVPGRHLRVRGERGWFRVIDITHNTRNAATWITATSVDPERPQVRAFDPARVTRVSRQVTPPKRGNHP